MQHFSAQISAQSSAHTAGSAASSYKKRSAAHGPVYAAPNSKNTTAASHCVGGAAAAGHPKPRHESAKAATCANGSSELAAVLRCSVPAASSTSPAAIGGW